MTDWNVGFSKKAAKQARELPIDLHDVLVRLIQDIKISGPVRGNWKNYSKLGPNEHHCHLAYKYVACWRVVNKVVQIIEVYYVGTREKAPY